MKLKILQLAAIDLTIYNFVLPLMKELQNNGFEVICASNDLGNLYKIEKQGFKSYNTKIERKIAPISNIMTIIELYKIIKKEDIDIIHVHTPIAGVLGRVAAKLAGVKTTIYTVHGFYFPNKLVYLIEKFMAKYLTDFIFTVNKEDFKYAIENNFISSNKILNINSIGIDTKKFNPENVNEEDKIYLKRSFNICETDKILGFVGRLVKEKGILDIVQAFIRVSSEMNNCKLLVIGSDDLGERDNNTREEVIEIIKKYNLGDKIIFTGYREDIPELLSIMDVFVLPSYREGMPVSLLEAMSMEKSVVATDIRGCKEEVDKTTGILYPPGDITKLTETLLYILNDPNKSNELGKNARQKVIDHFDEEKVITNQIQIYKSLIKN